MPTYQYACTNDDCGLRFERVQAFTDDPISSCPDCTQRVRKVYGSVGVVFKGSGFYRNDSRNTKADSTAPSGSSSSDAASDSSTKPAAASNGSSGSGAPDKPVSSGSNGAAVAKSSDRKASAPVAG
ncbi:MAG TPA: FmdB family zinc ribbon protein [Jatrophihabitans sp.]|nr:FmdB family zinc ribbon protein [Jatrophihabitans sp.]